MNFAGRASYSAVLLLLSGFVAWIGIVVLKFIPIPGIFGVLVLAIIIGFLLRYVGRKNIGPYFSKKYGAGFNKKATMASGLFALIIVPIFLIQSIVSFAGTLGAGEAAIISGSVTLLMYVFWTVGVIALFFGTRKGLQ